MNCPVRELTEQLIRCESVTPNDAGCLEIISKRLERLGFRLERIDQEGVSNLWATWAATAQWSASRVIPMCTHR